MAILFSKLFLVGLDCWTGHSTWTGGEMGRTWGVGDWTNTCKVFQIFGPSSWTMKFEKKNHLFIFFFSPLSFCYDDRFGYDVDWSMHIYFDACMRVTLLLECMHILFSGFILLKLHILISVLSGSCITVLLFVLTRGHTNLTARYCYSSTDSK